MSVNEKSALSLFHPVVERWFRSRVGEPTEVQRLAWPVIAAEQHVLVTAPTGSGKTFTAFLWALERLLTGAWEGGRIRALYVSPLKALNNDIQRNLLGPLAELEVAFEAADETAAAVRVVTRSGDTPQNERRKMLRRPPEILITTPESLNILLTSKSGRSILQDIRTVILDEIHAVAVSKRGTHLATAVERLAALSGEFQRVALSATIRPLEEIARFVGGYEITTAGGEAGYRRRAVKVVRSAESKAYEIQVKSAGDPTTRRHFLDLGESGRTDEPGDRGDDANRWDELVGAFKKAIADNRSTLIFANSRRTTEKLTRLLNEGEPRELVYSHHGSLSREIRSVVEERLKQGRLAAIVATSSLELGIDIGALDEVLLLATPPSVSSTVQRVGRSGHSVGQVSRARLFPFFARDFLDAAVMARCVLDQDLEKAQPIRAPLDVLAQVILSMVATETWQVEDLFRQIRASEPYHGLPRRQFDLVLDMLAGRYADSRIRELQPQISIDGIDGTLRGRPGAARRVYMGGGTIPDRGYFQLRVEESLAKLGELDEEFVWERSVGDTFSLGAQTWRVRKITHNDVLVAPAYKSAAMAPFWRAEERNRSFHLSERIGRFLEKADEVLAGSRGADELSRLLQEDYCLEAPAADVLIELLEAQRAQAGVGLPHRRRILAEHLRDDLSGPGRQHVILHTFWGGRVNRPWMIALAVAWKERHHYPLEIDCENDCLILTLPTDLDVPELFELVRADNLEDLLRQGLESTGFFGARFRENAGRALLLPRSDLRRRVPLWLQRERSKKLYEAVARYDDFPIVVETWRSCLRDGFDLDGLNQALDEIAAGEIQLEETNTTSPTPFAHNLVWKQTNRLMYEDDVPTAGRSAVRGDLLKELVFASELRPRIPDELLEEFEAKLQRVYPGYAPRSAQDLLDWVKERIVLPASEWLDLLTAIDRDLLEVGGSSRKGRRTSASLAEILAPVANRIVQVEFPARDQPSNDDRSVICALEDVRRVLRALGLKADEVNLAFVSLSGSGELIAAEALEEMLGESSTGEQAGGSAPEEELQRLLGEWVRFYGPFESGLLNTHLGVMVHAAATALANLADDQIVVVDRFRQKPEGADLDSPLEVCEVENLERLLRLLRARSRPVFSALPLAKLPLFLASYQGLCVRGEGVEGLQATLDSLFGYPAPARLWETELLPARLDPYYPAWLDRLFQDSELLWSGCGREKATFLFAADLDLLRSSPDQADSEEDSSHRNEKIESIFPDPRGRFSFSELVDAGGLDSSELTRRLWQAVWEGRASNTSFLTLRRGLLARFEPVESEAPRSPGPSARSGRRSRRARFDRWKAGRPDSGDWFLLPDWDLVSEGDDTDAIDREELNRERVRMLVERYGILFRELLERELPTMAWSRLFRTLRIMELSGEILSGHFFAGIPGPQFASRAAYRRLTEGLPEDVVYWMNAVDPASPCGLRLEELRGQMPSRRASNHLVYQGARLVVISRRGGGDLEIRVAPDHPKLEDYLVFLKVFLTRQFAPSKAIDIETINGEPATRSPYATRLREVFSVTSERQALRLRRRY